MKLPSGCDAVVIGLGPAGATAARELARAGLEVVALERSRFPRYKVCGGCLNSRAVELLLRTGLDVSGLGGPAITHFEATFGSQRLSLALPGGIALSRGKLDAFLADRAKDAGAVTEFGSKCSGLERVETGWLVRLEDGRSIAARTVLGADGLAGLVPKSCDRFRSNTVAFTRIGAGAVLEQSDAYKAGAIYMGVGRRGYVGATVVEHGLLNIAAAFDPRFVRQSGSPGRAAEAVLNECRMPVPVGLAEARWRGTPPLSQRTRPVASDGVFLLGDSAGYVEPFTGEGIAWAVEGAVELSKILIERARHGDSGSEATWNAAYKYRFARAQRRCAWIASGLRSRAVSATVAGLVGALPGLARPVIAEMNALAD